MKTQGERAYSPKIMFNNLEDLVMLLIELKQYVPGTEYRRSTLIYFIERFSDALMQNAARDGDVESVTRWAKVHSGETAFLAPKGLSKPEPQSELGKLVQAYNEEKYLRSTPTSQMTEEEKDAYYAMTYREAHPNGEEEYED